MEADLSIRTTKGDLILSFCSEDFSLRIHLIMRHLQSTTLSISNLHDTMLSWYPDGTDAVLWFTFAGGECDTITLCSVAKFVAANVDTVESVDVAIATKPNVFFNSGSETILLLEENHPVLQYTQQLASLQKLTRARIRGSFNNGDVSILPNMTTIFGAKLLPPALIRYVFLYREMCDVFSTHEHRLKKLFEHLLSIPCISRS